MNNIDHETLQYLINHKVDLLAFMNLSGRFTEDQYFTDEYYEKLKKYYRKNCKLYHPDKLRNASHEEHIEQTFKFSLNSAIYSILSNRQLYNEYKKSTELITHTHTDLKNNFKNTKDEIINIITETSKNKTYEEAVKDKETLHGITRKGTTGNATQFRDKEIDINTFTKMLTNYEADRVNFSTSIKNNHAKNKTLEFNEAFENNVLKETTETTIVPFCETTCMLTAAFDIKHHSYNDLYASAGGDNTIDKSFALLSSHIDKNKQFSDKINYDEAIQRYQSTTAELTELVKKSKK